MVKRFRAIIVGKVHGVFFRAATREKAMALQLTGFVRNLPNGSVEVDAEGEDEFLTDLLRWCRHGPPGARVDRVDVAWEAPKGDSRMFSIVA